MKGRDFLARVGLPIIDGDPINDMDFMEGGTRWLGRGVLTWHPHERRSDRYGSVHLIADDHTSMTDGPSPSLVCRPGFGEGQIGRLIVFVIEARDSPHIGDLFRGVGPRRPAVGQRIMLGSGQLFFEDAPDGGYMVGLKPADGRSVDWLDIRALYDAHEQLVELVFEPADGGAPCG